MACLPENARVNAVRIHEECNRAKQVSTVSSSPVLRKAVDHLRARVVERVADSGRDNGITGLDCIEKFIAR